MRQVRIAVALIALLFLPLGLPSSASAQQTAEAKQSDAAQSVSPPNAAAAAPDQPAAAAPPPAAEAPATLAEVTAWRDTLAAEQLNLVAQIDKQRQRLNQVNAELLQAQGAVAGMSGQLRLIKPKAPASGGGQ